MIEGLGIGPITVDRVTQLLERINQADLFLKVVFMYYGHISQIRFRFIFFHIRRFVCYNHIDISMMSPKDFSFSLSNTDYSLFRITLHVPPRQQLEEMSARYLFVYVFFIALSDTGSAAYKITLN